MALSVTWYKLRAHDSSTATGPSFSGILLRDGEIECMNLCYGTEHPIQDQYTSGTPHWETCRLTLEISDTLRKHIVHFELSTSYFHPAFCT